jgi:Family of unknown function (DUF5677)
MSLKSIGPDNLLPKYVPDWEKLESAEQESPFLEAGFYLLREATQLVIVTASLVPERPRDRNAAIVQGTMMRCAKLLRLLVRELAAEETFQQLGVLRSLLESLGTLKYLLDGQGTEDRFDKFVLNGLIAEREMLNVIRENVANRGGDVLNIEARMRRSIESTAMAAGNVDVSSLPARNRIGFPNAEARVRLLGPRAYMAYRGGSSEVHGDWTDLFRNHLTFEDGRYAPNPECPPVRPQASLSAVAVVVHVIVEHAEGIIPRPFERTHIVDRLKDVQMRVAGVTDLHEAMLARLPDDDESSTEG